MQSTRTPSRNNSKNSYTGRLRISSIKIKNKLSKEWKRTGTIEIEKWNWGLFFKKWLHIPISGSSWGCKALSMQGNCTLNTREWGCTLCMTVSTNERLWSHDIRTDSIKYSKTLFNKCPQRRWARIDGCIRRLWNEGLLAEQSWS